MTRPANPIAAATHPDPYTYYATLANEQPLAFNHDLGMWVAASAEAAQAVLADPRCRVRPLGEPVPEGLRWTTGEDIYRRLVRMTDGPAHGPRKQAVGATLASLDPRDVEQRARTWATHLLDTRPLLLGLPVTLPVHVIGDLLGIAHAWLPNTSIFVDQVVSWFAGGRGDETEARGALAATDLRLTLNESLLHAEHEGRINLLTDLARQMRAAGIADDETIVANALGFFLQAYDATAGLIGNALVALASQPELRTQLATEPEMIGRIVAQTAVTDPAIQNTRRYVAESGIIAGQPLQAGDTILVLLAAANVDAANAREAGQTTSPPHLGFSFGAGPHACPGAVLALTIARAGIEALLARGEDRWPPPGAIAYRPSINARVPSFTEELP